MKMGLKQSPRKESLAFTNFLWEFELSFKTYYVRLEIDPGINQQVKTQFYAVNRWIFSLQFCV